MHFYVTYHITHVRADVAYRVSPNLEACDSELEIPKRLIIKVKQIKAVVLLLLTFCLLLLPLWESVIVLCFVLRYFISILVLQSSWWGRESWLLFLICLLGVSWWLSGSSSRCHGVVCSLWLWYFLIILIYYFWYQYVPYGFIKKMNTHT